MWRGGGGGGRSAGGVARRVGDARSRPSPTAFSPTPTTQHAKRWPTDVEGGVGCHEHAVAVTHVLARVAARAEVDAQVHEGGGGRQVVGGDVGVGKGRVDAGRAGGGVHAPAPQGDAHLLLVGKEDAGLARPATPATLPLPDQASQQAGGVGHFIRALRVAGHRVQPRRRDLDLQQQLAVGQGGGTSPSGLAHGVVEVRREALAREGGGGVGEAGQGAGWGPRARAGRTRRRPVGPSPPRPDPTPFCSRSPPAHLQLDPGRGYDRGVAHGPGRAAPCGGTCGRRGARPGSSAIGGVEAVDLPH